MTDAYRPDRRAWMRSVLDRYEGPLTCYAARLVGDVDSARDVVQETFLRFCSDGAPQDDAGVGPWLFTVCRNQALDVLRRVPHPLWGWGTEGNRKNRTTIRSAFNSLKREARDQSL